MELSSSVLVTALRRLASWARASEARQGRGLVLLVLVAYLPAFSGGFVWDDWILVTEPLIRRWDGIIPIWLSPAELRYEGHYWPFVYTSFWIEHKLWGLHPAGYHAVNILLHAVNTLLIWRLLLRLAVPGAWLVAAVFAVHPVHVESVAWIIERKDLLSAVFYLGAVHVWLRFTESPGAGRYFLCLVLFVAALLSKSIAVTLPATLVLLQWWKVGRVTWRDAGYVAPLLAVALAITLGDFAFYRNQVESAFDYTLTERALIATRALWVYVWTLFWPVSLPVFYPRWEVHSTDVFGWLGFSALVTIGALLWTARRRIGRGPFACLSFFALTLSPVLGFVDFRFMDIAFVADRFQYLASIGPIAGALAVAVDRSAQLDPTRRAGVTAFAVVVVVGLSTVTWHRSKIYRDDFTFARYAVAVDPQHHFGQILLSYALANEGRHEGALAAARRAVILSEGLRGIDSAAAHHALGRILLSQDHPVRAEAELTQALALSIRNRRGAVLLELARSLVAQARYEEGLTLFQELRMNDPGNDLAHFHEGLAFLAAGRYEEAAESFNRALAVVRDPGAEPALYASAAEAWRRLGRLDAATARLDRALVLNPGHVRFLIARADLEAERQLAARPSSDDSERLIMHAPADHAVAMIRGAGTWLSDARERCKSLIEREPEHPVVRVLLGAVLLRFGEYEAAEAALDKAFALSPSRPVAREAHRVMGKVREKQGRTEDAARHYQNALDIYSLDAAALERLAALRFDQERYLEARALYRSLAKATPFVARAHFQLGVTLRHMGHFSEALPALKRALALVAESGSAGILEERIREMLASSADSAGRSRDDARHGDEASF